LKPSILIPLILGASVLAGALVGSVDFHEALATSSIVVSTRSGISLEDAIAAFSNERIRDDLGVKSVLAFSQSGGSADNGQKQQVLRVNLPLGEVRGGDVAFQYFVDVKDDMNQQTAFHCGDIRLHVYLDAKKVFVSGWLGYDDRDVRIPLKTSKIIIQDIPAGLHNVSLIPEGRTGGCNSGFIQSWGGTAVIFQ
jgi:hypothetical protein